MPAIFVTFDSADHPISLETQIKRAHAMAARYPTALQTILVKPETASQHYIQVDELVTAVSELKGLHILGVTEKELGGSAIDRMKNIASIRRALDAAGLTELPIHVFGSLDPVSVGLYFLSGAEIFDGLTWLKYAYLNGLAVYRQNAAARLDMLPRRDIFVAVSTMQRNLSYLTSLSNDMRKFLNEHDFRHFGHNEQLMRDAYELLKTKFKGKL